MSAIAKPENPSLKRPKFRSFHARDAADVSEEMMPFKVDEKDLAAIAKATEAGLPEGSVVRCLFKDDAAGMSLLYVWFKPNYEVPRHSHSADCLYFIISGEAHLGNEVLKAGDGFFVPTDGLYAYRAGPQGVELLEFRTATAFDLKVSASTAFWSKLPAVVTANLEMWRAQTPPLMVQRQDGRE